MRHFGCVACASLGYRNLENLELHHLLWAGKRISHWHTLFLCTGHHQGQFTDRQKRYLDKRYQVAISSGRKAFIKVFAPERELWEQLQARLGLDAPWPSSKILPRIEK